MNMSAHSDYNTVKSVYIRHKDEVDKNISVSDEHASFIIKTIMAGIPYRIYTYKGKVIKGNELLVVLDRCYNNSLVFTGKLYEAINGKTYKELVNAYRSLIEERRIEIIDFSYDSNPDEIKYFIETISKKQGE